MPEHDPEQELGPKITSALQDHADLTGMQKSGLAREARRRVHRRRQAWSAAAGAVLVAAVGGGVWGLAGSQSPVASSHSDAASAPAAGTAKGSPGIVGPRLQSVCPGAPAIQRAAGPNALPAGTGLDLSTPVTGMTACRYKLSDGTVLGQQSFDASAARQVVAAIRGLPERNPELPVFKCAPQTAKPAEAIVLRFDTADGVREIWVEYDGCESPGFFTGTHTYGLYAAPLKLFMVGAVRPSGSTYLNALQGW